MAHFGYADPSGHPVGVWANGDTPGGAAFTAWDQGLFKAINGDEGGTWAPSSPIVIGGAGINIHRLNDSEIPFGSTLTFYGGLIGAYDGVHGGHLGMASGSLTVFAGVVQFITGASVSVQCKFTEGVNGRWVRRFVPGATLNHNYGIDDGTIIIVPTLSADIIYTLSRTGALEGDVITIAFDITQTNGHHKVTLVDAGAIPGSTIMFIDRETGNVWSVDMQFLNGAWTPLSFTKN